MFFSPNSSDRDGVVVPFEFYQGSTGETENPVAEAGSAAKTWLTVAKWFASRPTSPESVGQVAAQLIRFKPEQVVTAWTGLGPGEVPRQTAWYDEKGFRYELGGKKILTESKLPPGHRFARVNIAPPEQLLERCKDSPVVRVLSKTANTITKALKTPAGQNILKGGAFGINCLCAYDPSQENALAKALVDGTAVFTISSVQVPLMKQIASAIGLGAKGKFFFVIGLSMAGSIAAADPHYDQPIEDVAREASRAQREVTEKLGVFAPEVYGPVILDYGVGKILRWFSPKFVYEQMNKNLQAKYPLEIESHCLVDAKSIDMLNTALKDIKSEVEFPGIFHPSFDPNHFLREQSFDLPFPSPAAQTNRREPVVTEIKQREDYEENEATPSPQSFRNRRFTVGSSMEPVKPVNLKTPQEKERFFAKQVAKIEENFAKIRELQAQVLGEDPDSFPLTASQSRTVSSTCSGNLNLDTLTPTSSTAFPSSQYVNVHQLDQCSLDWKVNPAATSLQTSMEIPSQDLDALQALPVETPTVEVASPETTVARVKEDPVLVPDNVSLTPIHAPKPKTPSFGELAKITDIRFGEGIGGGAGLVCTLASGAKFSVSTTGSAVLTGTSIPLSKGFLTGLQTGLLYSAPIAALMIGVQQFVQNKADKKVLHHLKRDARSAQKDVSNVDKTLQDFDAFFGQFQRGEIDGKTFTDRVNKISDDLQRSARKMGDRGNYAEGHRHQTPGSGFQYFFEKTKLRQIDLDLKKLTEEAFASREVKEHFTPQLRARPLDALVRDLTTFSNQRVLSLKQKYEQEALVSEISSRSKSEDLDALQHLDSLATHPVAISLNPQGVAKPNYINEKRFNRGEHAQERLRHRVKHWANDLNTAYIAFQEAAKAGDVGAMERAAGAVNYQIARADGNHDVNLESYKLLANRGEPINALEYYQNFINSIKSNTKDTLAKAQEAQKASVSEVNPAFFTNKEIQDFKIQAANNAFNTGLASLNSETATAATQDVAFTAMFKAAQVLESQEVDDPHTQKVLKIGAEYGSYSKYQEAIQRLSTIESRLQKLLETTKQLDDATSPDEHSRIYKIAFDVTNDLIVKDGISEADIRKLTNKDDDQAPKILALVHSIHEKYPQYQIETTRLKGVQSKLEILQATTKEMEADGIKPKEFKRLYEAACAKANQVMKDGLTEADISKLIGKDGDPKVFMEWIKSIPVGYQNFVRIGEYQSRTLPLVATPLSRFALVVLNDSHRFDRPRINFGIQAFSSLNSLAPGLFPAGVNYLLARGFKEKTAVTNGLAQQCLKAVQANVITGLQQDVLHPKKFLDKSLNKKVGALKGANAAVQIAATAVRACTAHYWKDSPAAENLNGKVQNAAFVMNAAANAAFNANTVKKTYEYIKLGTLGLKAHKVGQGLADVGMSCFDIYEFLATNPAEFGYSKELVETVQKYLPSFHGNLPESNYYYMGKDALLTLALASYSLLDPLMAGMTALQGGSSLFHLYRGKYTEDGLAATMINLRHFAKQPPSEKIASSIKASYKNLISHLNEDFTIADSESKIRQKAKQVAFEHRLASLVEEENWDEILSQTEIVREVTGEKLTYKFKSVNMDVNDAIPSLFKRFNALINKMAVNDMFGANAIDNSLKELENLSSYLTTHLEALSPREREKSAQYIEWVNATLEDQKVKLLTNYCVFYVKKQLHVSPLEALERFDEIPLKERTLVHWFTLGVISNNLFQEVPAPKLQDVQLFCFEHILAEIREKEAGNCELSPFELELRKVSSGILRELSGAISSSHIFWKETAHFTPVIKDILSLNGKQKALSA